MATHTKTLYVLTHTETYYNKHRIFSGRLNSLLTSLGHRQAEKMAKKLRRKDIRLAFISPLRRTRQTLEHIAKFHPGLKIYTDPRLTERDYGRLSRKSKVKYKKEHPDLYQIHHRSYRIPPPGGESMVTVEKRVLASLRTVLARMKKNDANAVIITHNNSIRPIRRYFEKLDPEQMMHQDNRHKIYAYKIKMS